MTLYARLSAQDEIVEKRNFPDAFPPDPEIAHKGIKWLPYEITKVALGANQLYDPAAPIITILADKITETWTARDKTAQELSEELTARLDAAIAQFDKTEDVFRASMLMILDEFNTHSAKMNTLLDAIDAAASLAALKTAVAAITNLPTRDAAQIRVAIRAKLGNGS